MDCQQTLALISRDLDGRLDTAGRLALLTHTNSCAACAESLALQVRMSAALHSRVDLTPPDGTARRVADAVLDRNRTWRPVRLPLLRVAAALLFCFVLGGIGGYWVDASAKEARAGAAANATRLEQEAAAWRSVGADEALTARIMAVRARQFDAQAGASVTEWPRLEAEATAGILRILPEPIAAAWCASSGVSPQALKALRERTGR